MKSETPRLTPPLGMSRETIQAVIEANHYWSTTTDDETSKTYYQMVAFLIAYAYLEENK